VWAAQEEGAALRHTPTPHDGWGAWLQSVPDIYTQPESGHPSIPTTTSPVVMACCLVSSVHRWARLAAAASQPAHHRVCVCVCEVFRALIACLMLLLWPPAHPRTQRQPAEMPKGTRLTLKKGGRVTRMRVGGCRPIKCGFVVCSGCPCVPEHSSSITHTPAATGRASSAPAHLVVVVSKPSTRNRNRSTPQYQTRKQGERAQGSMCARLLIGGRPITAHTHCILVGDDDAPLVGCERDKSAGERGESVVASWPSFDEPSPTFIFLATAACLSRRGGWWFEGD
jgi:hypothetical protein